MVEKKKKCEYSFNPQVYVTSFQEHTNFSWRTEMNLRQSRWRSKWRKNGTRIWSSSEEDNGSTDLDHDISCVY